MQPHGDTTASDASSSPGGTSFEKQVLFANRVVIMKTVPKIRQPEPPDQFSSLDSTDLESSQVALARRSSSLKSSWLFSGSKKACNGLRVCNLERSNGKYNYGYADKSETVIPIFDSDCNSRRAQRCWDASGWILVALLSIAVAVLLAMVLTWLIVMPKRPDLRVGTAHVHSLIVDSSATAAFAPTYFSANISLDLLVSNPNRVRTSYSTTTLSVTYRDMTVGVASVPKFIQAAHSRVHEKVLFYMKRVHLSGSNALNLLRDYTARDSVSLEVNGHVNVRLRILGLSTPSVKLKLWCIIEIKVSNLEIFNQQCHVKKHKFMS